MSGAFSVVTKPSLERIRSILERLGRPDRELEFVHVAGTNGKGSVCAFIEAGLSAAGFRVGKFTSPNLVRVNERITVDGSEIDDMQLQEALSSARAAAEGTEATMFELWCAGAMLHFRKMHCDIVVLEVGLGGEFDATNIIDPPKLAVICHIDFDHMKYLGDTLESIAAAKCGIIKNGTKRVICGPQYPHVLGVVRDICAQRNVQLEVVSPPAPDRFEDIYECIEYKGIKAKLSLGGIHQIVNACTAADTLIALGVDQKSVKRGLENAKNPGRFERIGQNLIFDGAHNPDGIRALAESLRRYFPSTRPNIVFACMKDKDIKPSLILLSELAGSFSFVTVSDNQRAMPVRELAELALKECRINGSCFDLLEDALKAENRGILTVICGSLYLYRDLPQHG